MSYKNAPEHAEVKYIYSVILAEVTRLPVSERTAAEQEALHHHEVCYCDAAVCVDVSFDVFCLFKYELLSAAVPELPLTDVCSVVSTYFVNIKAAQTV